MTGLRDDLHTRAQLLDLPRPTPLIAGTLDRRTVAVLAGRRGRGKSFVALDWALSLATGKPWQGRTVVEPCPVIWIAAEGAYGLNDRITAWETAWHEPVERFAAVSIPVNLYTGRHVDELLEIVTEHRAGFVVFDTWARCTVGGKENDNSDATAAMARLEPFRAAGITCLVVAHTDADDTKTRGATAVEDNVDTVYRLKGDPDHLVLSRTKRKDGPEHDELHLRLTPTAPSVVVESATTVDMGGRTADLMSIYVQHFADTGCTKNELRDVAAEGGMKSSGTFTRALNALVNSGALVNTGSDPRPFYKQEGTLQ